MGRFLATSFQQRAASACVLMPAVLAILYYGGTAFVIGLVILMILSLYEWVYVASKTRRRIIYSVVGLVYILLSFYCCFLIRENFALKYGVVFLIMIWASDIGAYVVGKKFKGPKMAVEISPNKTWSGYVGALVTPGLAAIAAFVLYEIFSGRSVLVGVDLFYLLCAGGVIGLVGQSGDLLVSYLKRRANVKDTGRLIPGHGGILDRIDSLLLAAPVYLFIITKFSHVIGH